MKIKVKAKEKNGIIKAKMLIKHVMETGRRKDKEGKLIPAHHLTELKAEYKGEIVFSAEFGPAVSKDPFIAFSFAGASGDSFTISAVDTKGETGQAEVTVK
jgi:sulfur-oxidizing protein SoxZ